MMACKDDNKKKCFTMIWKLENVNDWLYSDFFESPVFTVEEIDYTNWKLKIIFNRYFDSYLALQRQSDDEDVEEVVIIDCELAFVSSDGTVLHSVEEKNAEMGKYGLVDSGEFPSWNEVFFARRSVFLSQATLTVRCRMWKSVGEIAKDVQCFARTRTVVEKSSFLWNIENFSTLTLEDKQTYEIKSLRNGKHLMTLELFVIVGLICEEKIRLKMIDDNEIITACTIQVSIVDASKNIVKCLDQDFRFDYSSSIEFTVFYTKRELMEKKSAYLPNDVLSLVFEFSFCFDTLTMENEGDSFKCAVTESKEPGDRCFDIENVLVDPKSVLIDNLKSMLNSNTLSDIKLRTKTKTHPAHKCILSSRSPVFESMFSNEMRDNIANSVDIEDLTDDTVTRMLQYIYSADVGYVEWSSAMELYEAANKYEILPLKDNCSSCIKTRLCPSNACDALVLADLHEDKDLKTFVQDFTLRHGKDIMNSEEWEHLMKNNLKLAAETMHLLYKK